MEDIAANELINAVSDNVGSALHFRRQLQSIASAVSRLGLDNLASELDFIADENYRMAKAAQGACGYYWNCRANPGRERLRSQLQASLKEGKEI